jgi:hypothetical protein
MILAFQSTQQAFTTFFAVQGALLICAAVFDWDWLLDRRSPGFSRAGARLVLAITGIGAIAMAWLVAYS